MSEPEDPRVKRWNDVQPPQPSWTIAADYCRACGIDETEKRGDYYQDLYKAVNDPHWKRFYGLLMKLYHDAASDGREFQKIAKRLAEYGGDVPENTKVPEPRCGGNTPAPSPSEEAA